MTDSYPLDRVLDGILLSEGWPLYTDDPEDRGGPTKGGITLATLAGWRGRLVTTLDLRELDEAEARAIYRNLYVESPRFGEIEDGLLRYQVVDAGVHSGPARASRWLQEAVGGVQVDGRVGPITLAAVHAADPHLVGVRLAAIRIRFLGDLIERDRRQAKYADGWLTRATSFLDLEAAAGPRRPREVAA